jgi:hypothetical protein
MLKDLKSDLELFIQLATKDYAFVALLISLIGFIVSAFTPLYPPIILLLAIFSFTAFDTIGWESVAHSEDRMNIVRYRIDQTVFQYIIAALAMSVSGGLVWVTIGYILLWWIGLCDVLFYYLLKKQNDLYSYGNMPWVWWTPLGIYNKIYGRDTNGKELTIISFGGLILWLIIWFIFPSLHSLTFHSLFTSLHI